METLHRLAGVSDVSKPLPPPPPIPQDDSSEQQLSRRASRASLPRDLHRTPSKKSVRSRRSHSRENLLDEPVPPLPTSEASTPASPTKPSAPAEPSGESEIEAGRPSNVTAESTDDFAWGPSHPCFPHPNPHCTPDSEEFRNTRVIRVKRDWLISGDLFPQYVNLYPEILDPLVSDSDFRFLIMNINTRLQTIFSPWNPRAWIDAILGILTAFIWDDVGMTRAKSGIRDLERYIERWNEQKASEGYEVRIVQLRRTGFLALDFIVPDPGIDTTTPPEEGPTEEGERKEERGV